MIVNFVPSEIEVFRFITCRVVDILFLILQINYLRKFYTALGPMFTHWVYASEDAKRFFDGELLLTAN